jgi:hypothetical protein
MGSLVYENAGFLHCRNNSALSSLDRSANTTSVGLTLLSDTSMIAIMLAKSVQSQPAPVRRYRRSH